MMDPALNEDQRRRTDTTPRDRIRHDFPSLSSFIQDYTVERHYLRRILILGGFVAALLGLGAQPGFAQNDALDTTRAPSAPMHEVVMMLPGDPARPVQLQVTMFTPDGQGPFPLAVLVHGAADKGQKPHDMPRYRYTYSAYYFLSRGYAVALPMMRGFAGSGGHLINHGCDLADLGFDSARDIEAVIADLRKNPHIDTRRVVVAGQSFGGWNTLALGALHPSYVVGLVNFVGGVRTTGCDQSTHQADQALVSAAGVFGATTKVPSIWFYGDNDSIFPVPVWHAMYEQYTRRGGEAQLVDFGKFGTDSHQMLSSYDGLPIWTGRVDAFLASIGMPAREVAPQYMPLVPPPASHFAALNDVDAVPNLQRPGRQAYLNFLAYALPRAFVLSDDGGGVASTGGFDPLGRALKICHDDGVACYPYAVDNTVVWAMPRPFAPIADVKAVPYLSNQSRRSYAQFLELPLPRAFIIAPDGGWAAADGRHASAEAMAYCRARHRYCSIYAMNQTVIWRQPLP